MYALHVRSCSRILTRRPQNRWRFAFFFRNDPWRKNPPYTVETLSYFAAKNRLFFRSIFYVFRLRVLAPRTKYQVLVMAALAVKVLLFDIRETLQLAILKRSRPDVRTFFSCSTHPPGHMNAPLLLLVRSTPLLVRVR